MGVGGAGILTIEDGAVLSNPLAYVEIAKYGDSTGTVFVTGSDSTNSSTLSAGGLLRVGDSGFGTLTVENGGLADAGSVEVGDYASAIGQLIIDAGSTVRTNSASMVDVGQFQGDTGPVTVTAGSFVVGVQSAAVGSVKANGGTLQVEGDLEVGGAGTGVMTASASATVTSVETDLGEFTGGVGVLTLSGSGTTWTDTSANSVDSNSAGINVGVNGTGTLTVEGGAVLSNPMSYIKIGQNPGAIGTATVTGTSSVLSAGGLLRVGDSGTGTLTVEDGGLAAAGQAQVGDFGGSVGEIDIDAGGSVTTNASTIDVGAQIGATVAAGSFVVGVQSGAQGTVNVNGGTLNVDADITVGDYGTGRLAISAGGTVTSQSGDIGTGGGDEDAVTVDGAHSSWTMSAVLHMGGQGQPPTSSLTISNDGSVSTTDPGSGYDEILSGTVTLDSGGQLSESGVLTLDPTTLTVENGATLTENGTTFFNYFPYLVGLYFNGTMTIDDATLASSNAETVIGAATSNAGAGTGVLTASDGATITSLGTYLGYYAGDSGTVILSGSGTTWTDTSANSVDSNSAGINVGVNGTGTLTVEGGAVLSNPMSYIKIGQNPGAIGTATVTGTGSVLSAGGLLRVGDSGTGTLTVEDGGLAAAGQVQVSDFGGSVGEIDIDAGGSVTTNASTIDVGAQIGATVAAGSFDIGVQGGSQGAVNVDGGTLNVGGAITVGDGGSGSLVVGEGSRVMSQDLDIGTGSSNDGVVTVDGPNSSWAISGSLHIGVGGGTGNTSLTISNEASVSSDPDQGDYDILYSGTLTLEGGGKLTENGLVMLDAASLVVGSGATLTENSSGYFNSGGLTADGMITIDDATLDSTNARTAIGFTSNVGGETGTLTASDGASIISLETDLAESSGDSGTVTLTGPGTTWTDTSGNAVDSNDAGFNVGVSGTGVLTVEDGAVLANPSAYIKIGQYGGSTGTATVTGTGSVLSAGGLLRVGDSGTGTLTVEDGGLAAAGQVQVSDFGGSVGEIDIDAGGSVTTNASTIDVGAQIGATVAAGSFVVGVQSGAQGTVNVDGGTLGVDGDLIVGDAGTGALTISDGGMASATTAQIGVGGSGTVTLDAGGTLVAGSVEVGADGDIVMAGGTLDPPNTITIDAGGTISGFGTVLGNVADNGMLEALGGTLVISGALSGGGSAVVGENGIIEFKSTFTGIVAFAAGITGTLRLDQPSLTTPPTISGFTVGDTINLSSVTYDPAGSAGLEPGSNNVLQIIENGTPYTLDLDPTLDYVGHDFLLSPDMAAGGTDITVGQVPLTGPGTVPAGETTSDVVVASGGSLTVTAGATATGTTVETGGELKADAGSTITDSVIDYGGVLDLATGAAASGTIQFGPPQGDPIGGTLEIDDTAPLSATITGFADGDTIDLTGINYIGGATAQLLAGNELQLSAGGATYDLQFDPTQSFAGDYFDLAADSGGGTAITVSPLPASADRNFLNALYEDILDRPIDPTALSYYETQLAEGVTNEQIAYEVVTSPEAYQDLVTSWFQQYLERAPDDNGLATFTSELLSGATEEQVQANILGSPEFFQDAGGTDTAFVTALYQDLLGRAPGPGEAELLGRRTRISRADTNPGCAQLFDLRRAHWRRCVGVVREIPWPCANGRGQHLLHKPLPGRDY